MTKDKAILITGATGMIGSSLYHSLIENGQRIIVLSRDSDRAKDLLPKADGYMQWNQRSSISSLSNILWEIKAIINLSGAPISNKWSDSYKKEIYSSRVDETRKLLSTIEASNQRPTTFISASAIGYYGSQPLGCETPLDENNASGNDFLAKVCIDWEREVLKAESLNMNRYILRLGTVLSKKGGMLKKLLPFFYAGLGGSLGSGRQWISWIHIKDVIEGCKFLLNQNSNHRLNICNFVAPQPQTMENFTKKLSSILSRPSIFKIPELVIKLILGEASSIVLGSILAKPKALTEMNYSFYFPTLKEALEDILTKKP